MWYNYIICHVGIKIPDFLLMARYSFKINITIYIDSY